MPIKHDMMHAQSPDEVAALKARIHELESMPHTDNSAVIENLINENEALKKELLDAKRDACRFEKAMYRALMNWSHARSFIYLKEHHASIDSEIPPQWKRAMELCGLGYEFAQIMQDKLPKKPKKPEVK